MHSPRDPQFPWVTTCRKRLFRTLPSKAESQTGVVLVTVLFAIAIGRLAAKISEHVVAIVRTKCFQSELDILDKVAKNVPLRCDDLSWYGALGERFAAVLHLTVAAALIVTSAVGYYNSRQLPKLNVTFFNLPLVQALLDIAMVVTYYILVDLVEPRAEAYDARPEAILVSIAFWLYVFWDLANYRVSKDEYSQVALRKVPQRCVEYGYRRGVTLTFCGIISAATFVYYILVNVNALSGKTPTVLMDLFLLFSLILYRIFKPLRDRSTHFRGETKCEKPVENDPPLPYTNITPEDLRRLLPEIDDATRHLIKYIGNPEIGKLRIRANTPLYKAFSGRLSALATAQAAAQRCHEDTFFEIEVNRKCQKSFEYELTVKLTPFGRFVYSIYENDRRSCHSQVAHGRESISAGV